MMDTLLWLEQSILGDIIRRSLYPWIQIAHIVSFSVMVGVIALVDLRILGCFPRLPLLALIQGPLRLAHLSFGVVLVSGFLLFVAQPSVLVVNVAFQLKLLLILAAGINAAVLHWQVIAGVKEQNLQGRAIAARVGALLSLTLWLTVIACGRMIAYV